MKAMKLKLLSGAAVLFFIGCQLAPVKEPTSKVFEKPPLKMVEIDPREGLQILGRYLMTQSTPLMPKFDVYTVEGLQRALERIEYQLPRTIIRVLEVRNKRGIPWYKVECDDGDVGWINSLALYNQTVYRID